MTTYHSKIDLSNIPAAIAAAKGRKGRDPGVIAADWAACDIYTQDVQASVKQIAAAAIADGEQTMRKTKQLSIASLPANIAVAGMVIRRSDPVAESQALHDALMARGHAAIASIKALHERQDAVQALVAELIAELDRAGVPEAEARAWLKSATVTRLPKAAA